MNALGLGDYGESEEEDEGQLGDRGILGSALRTGGRDVEGERGASQSWGVPFS